MMDSASPHCHAAYALWVVQRTCAPDWLLTCCAWLSTWEAIACTCELVLTHAGAAVRLRAGSVQRAPPYAALKRTKAVTVPLAFFMLSR